MKISIFLIYSAAAIALLTLSPNHQSDALDIGGLKSTTTGNGKVLYFAGHRPVIRCFTVEARTADLQPWFQVATCRGEFTFPIPRADVLKLGQKAGSGVIENIPALIPSAASIVNLSKQTVLGLPFEAVLSTVDQLCMYLLDDVELEWHSKPVYP